jgi:predicted transcriptional regulator
VSPRGRPPIGPGFTIRLDPDTRAELERLAAERDVKIADIARELIHQALNHEEAQ